MRELAPGFRPRRLSSPALACIAVASFGMLVARAEEPGDAGALPAGVVARFGSSLLRHAAPVRAVALSHDGKVVASASDDVVLVHDATTARVLARFPLTGPCSAVALSASATHVAAACGRAIVSWELASGRATAIPAHEGGTRLLAFSSDGRVLASAAGDEVSLHDVDVPGRDPSDPDPGPASRELAVEVDDARALALSSDGARLAVADRDGSIRLVSTRTGRTRARLLPQAPRAPRGGRILVDATEPACALAFAADGRTLAACGPSGATALWNVAEGRLVRRATRPQGSRVAALSFVAGRPLVAASTAGNVGVVVFDLATDEVLHGVEARDATAVALSGDQSLLAIGRATGRVELHELATRTERFPDEGHKGAVVALAFSSDGRRIASAGDDGARVFDLTARRLERVLEIPAPASAAAWSPDGRWIAVGSGNVARIVDATTFEPGLRLGGPSRPVSVLAFSPDGEMLAGGSRDQFVRHWSVQGGRVRNNYQTWSPLVGLAWAPQGSVVYTAGDEGTVRAFDVSGTGIPRELRRREPAARAQSLALSPDGRTLALACVDGSVRVWDAATFEERWSIVSHKGPAKAVVLTNAKGWSGGEDGALVPFDPTTGRELARLPGHPRGVASLALSRDGKLLASGGEDGTILVHRVD